MSTSISSKPTSKSSKQLKDKSAKDAANTSSGTSASVHKLSLKGSAKIVAEFFDYSLNTILFQRGVYPAEDFTPVKKYGLNMLISSDESVRSYLKRITTQVSKWLQGGKIKTLVVVITEKDEGKDIERWSFDVSGITSPPSTSSQAGGEGGAKSQDQKAKTEADIQNEIASLFRQITACVTFLPQLDGRCSFNVLVYTDGDVEVPTEWGDSDPREISGGEKVALRSWGTMSHRVDTAVSYRVVD